VIQILSARAFPQVGTRIASRSHYDSLSRPRRETARPHAYCPPSLGCSPGDTGCRADQEHCGAGSISAWFSHASGIIISTVWGIDRPPQMEHLTWLDWFDELPARDAIGKAVTQARACGPPLEHPATANDQEDEQVVDAQVVLGQLPGEELARKIPPTSEHPSHIDRDSDVVGGSSRRCSGTCGPLRAKAGRPGRTASAAIGFPSRGRPCPLARRVLHAT
jgi:hypothetical protein